MISCSSLHDSEKVNNEKKTISLKTKPMHKCHSYYTITSSQETTYNEKRTPTI